MRRLLLVASLLVLVPGCLTGGVWSWAHDEGTDCHKAVEIVEVAPQPDGGFTVRVRMADGSEQVETWGGESSRGPTSAFADACRAARFEQREEALEALARAIRRGLQRRGFATERDLAPIADDPELTELDATPLALPTLILRDPDPSRPVVDSSQDAWVDVVHLAPPEPAHVLFQVPPVTKTVDRGGPLGYAAAVVATPVTFALDVVTFPVQLAVALWILDGLFDWLE